MILYDTAITFRGKIKHISNLNEGSHKKIKMKCPICGKEFERYAFILFKSGNFMCQACTLEYKLSKPLPLGVKYNKLTTLENLSKGKVKVRCDCGNIKVADSYSVKSGHTKSCGCIISDKLKKFRKDNPTFQTKENHPNWKGGVSSRRQCLMATKEYKDWRTFIFTKDKYTCQKCGRLGGELEAHHILPYSMYPDKVLDKDNGITLCKECHKKFHHKFGIKNITEQDLIEFLNKR